MNDAPIRRIRAEHSQTIFEGRQWAGHPDQCFNADQQDRSEMRHAKVNVACPSPPHDGGEYYRYEAQDHESDKGGMNRSYHIGLEMIRHLATSIRADSSDFTPSRPVLGKLVSPRPSRCQLSR